MAWPVHQLSSDCDAPRLSADLEVLKVWRNELTVPSKTGEPILSLPMKSSISAVRQLRPFSQGSNRRARVLQIPILGGNKTPQPPQPLQPPQPAQPAQETKMSALNGTSVGFRTELLSLAPRFCLHVSPSVMLTSL
jgi:hypothetical protein